MRISDSYKIASEFKQMFGLNLNDYLIQEFKCIGQAVIDVPKLDDYLLETHSDYVETMSMEEFIKKHYGVKGHNLMMKLINM